jgi:hypothetical protein
MDIATEVETFVVDEAIARKKLRIASAKVIQKAYRRHRHRKVSEIVRGL